MEKVNIIYATNMGTTELLAHIVRQAFMDAGIESEFHNANEISPRQILRTRITILGCPTWAFGEFPEEFMPFEEEMRRLNFRGRKAAIFGPANSVFREFGKSVDNLEKTLKNGGAELLVDSLKIDESKIDGFFAVERWARNLADVIRSTSSARASIIPRMRAGG